MKRGRKSTGTVLWHKNQWHVRVTDPATGKRPYIPIPGDIPRTNEELANSIGAVIAQKFSSGNAITDSPVETVNEYAKRWLEMRDFQGLSAVRTDRSRFNAHISPLIGTFPMSGVTKRDVEAIVLKWDEKIHAGESSWKTVTNAWALLTKMFDDAQNHKDHKMRMREDNPCFGVRGPDRGATRAKAYLYPSEFLKLMNHPEVPLRWKQLFAAAVYLYARRGEMAALTRGDVDLEHGLVHIHSSEGENGRSADVLKTAHQVSGSVARMVPVEKTFLPLLKTLCRGKQPHEFVFDMPHEDRLSAGLRYWLQEAGVIRSALHSTDRTRKNITFHDLRATGITWCAVRGDKPLRIMQRAGHANFQTTKKYIREAEPLQSIDFGQVFPELPSEVANSVQTVRTGPKSKRLGKRLGTVLASVTIGNYATKSCEGGDLNPTCIDDETAEFTE